MKRKRKTGSLKSEMNVVPYIDVMLVLLIIFMVTAPMFVPAVINLPSVGKASQLTAEPIEVIITKDGKYSVTQKSQTFQIDTIPNLVSKVQSLIKGDTPIVLSADKETKYDSVIGIVDKLYAAGIKKVALVVKEKNG
ncbi:MAG: protein TolR [Burkholderiales bacterium]|nr:protein TolR [Burkholderiales bacterium]